MARMSHLLTLLGWLGHFLRVLLEVGLLSIMIYSILYFLRGTKAAPVLGGITVVEGEALVRTPSDNLYSRAGDVTFAETDLLAVPYYAWDNQTPGAMTVWMPGSFTATKLSDQ